MPTKFAEAHLRTQIFPPQFSLSTINNKAMSAAPHLQLYFGVRLAERPYERIAVNNVDATKKTIELKLDAQEMLNNLNKELGMFRR